VPDELMRERLAPSYKAICFALLNNDHALEALGFVAPVSSWYSTLKAIELSARKPNRWRQLRLPLW
jgi:predicted phosphoadenosine phosphosulfate sulfurtransferase